MWNGIRCACLSIVLTGITVESGALQQADARSILEAAHAAALGITDEFLRGEVLDRIGAATATAGDLNRAVEISGRAYPHTTSTWRALGEQLATGADLQSARSIGAQLKGGGASTLFYTIASRQAERGRVDAALQTAALIEAPEVRGSALRAIAGRQVAKGDEAGAQNTLARAQQLDSRSSMPDEAAMLVLQGQFARGDLDAARAGIARLPTGVRFAAQSEAIAMLVTKGDRAAAGSWLDEALRAVPAGPEGAIVQYFMIPLTVQVGQVDRAMKTAAELPADFRLKGYTAIAVTCAEAHDIPCVNMALARMVPQGASTGDRDLSQFQVKLMTLNVTAALIVAGEFEAAFRWLTAVDAQLDDVSRLSIEPTAQMQRVVALALQGKFDEARALGGRIRTDSVAENQRGTALRTIAVLQTKRAGAASSRPWASGLTDAADRAYALLGVAQALLGIDDVKLSYGAISIH